MKSPIISKAITHKQLDTLQKLIKEVEPEMVIPKYCTTHMAARRIHWLLMKKYNRKITKKQYMT